MSSLPNSDIQTDSVAVNSNPSVLFYPGNRIHEAEMLSKRLLTFKNYKGKKSPLQLAMAGFVYTGTSDKVVCESCGIRLFKWTGNEDPLEEHRKHTSGCSFIRAKFSTTGDSEYNKSHSTSSSIAKYKDYKSYEKRLESFIGWPLLSPLQKPNILARSGFFYIGSADRARCFHCGLTLRDWDDDDFPPVVHKKQAKNCEFAQKLDIGEISKMVEVQSSKYPHSPAIQAVLDMGYCIELIRKAIDDRKRNEGSDFPDAVSLFYAVSELEEKISIFLEYADQMDIDDIRKMFEAEKSKMDSKNKKIHVEKSCNYTYSSAIQAVLDEGCSIELIGKAIDNRKRKDGSDFPDAVSLFKAVLELEEN